MSSKLFPILLANCVVIALAVILGLVNHPGHYSKYFDEGRFPMIFSCLQLAAIGVCSVFIFRKRRAASADRSLTAGYYLWLIMAAGFVFLTLDEGFQFHERFDEWVHKTAHWKKTDVTDRLDDFLIGGYAVVGIGVLALYHREMRAARVMLPPMILGFVFTGLSVAGDSMSHHHDFFLALGAGKIQARNYLEFCEVLDGGCTLLAEGCFVAAFLLACQHFAQQGSAAAIIPEPVSTAEG